MLYGVNSALNSCSSLVAASVGFCLLVGCSTGMFVPVPDRGTARQVDRARIGDMRSAELVDGDAGGGDTKADDPVGDAEASGDTTVDRALWHAFDGGSLDLRQTDLQQADLLADVASEGPADLALDRGVADEGAGDALRRDQGSAGPIIVITEVLYDPDAVPDETGEWFEVYNAGASALVLHGWTIRDNYGRHVIAAPSLVVAPGAYAVLARSANQAINGGVTADYSYGNAIQLSNKADRLELLDPQKVKRAGVTYDETMGWPVARGGSISLKQLSAADDPTSWCVEQAAWSGSSGDDGTPGSASGC